MKSVNYNSLKRVNHFIDYKSWIIQDYKSEIPNQILSNITKKGGFISSRLNE